MSRGSVVVVGAGHNGLTAACYLARAGFDVTVCEAAEQVGGMTRSAALVPAAPGHLVSPCAIDAVYWRASPVERELDLARFGLRMIEHDPAWAWLGPDGESLVLRRDVARTVADIARFSRRDAEAYREFVLVAERALSVQDTYALRPAARPGRGVLLAAVRALRDAQVRRLLGAALTTSAAQIITETFESPQMRGAFAAMASILGSVTADSSGIGVLATAPLHRDGVVRPVGGMQAIPDALVRCLAAAGGRVRTSAAVERLTVRDGAVRGVVLHDGELLAADHVVCAVPPQVVALLLGGDDGPLGDGVEALRRAPSNASGVGCLTVGLALSGYVSLPGHQPHRDDDVDLRAPTLFFGTLDQIERSESEARAGRVPQSPPWTATILSARDPSQAPPGEDTLYLYAPAPVRPDLGWPGASSIAEKSLLAAAGSILDGVAELEIGRFVETPESLQQRTGAANGCIYHVDQTVTRLGPLRPALGWGGRKPRVPGLVLSGAGTHPGGGVSGLPGRLAAQAVLATARRGSG